MIQKNENVDLGITLFCLPYFALAPTTRHYQLEFLSQILINLSNSLFICVSMNLVSVHTDYKLFVCRCRCRESFHIRMFLGGRELTLLFLIKVLPSLFHLLLCQSHVATDLVEYQFSRQFGSATSHILHLTAKCRNVKSLKDSASDNFRRIFMF